MQPFGHDARLRCRRKDFQRCGAHTGVADGLIVEFRLRCSGCAAVVQLIRRRLLETNIVNSAQVIEIIHGFKKHTLCKREIADVKFALHCTSSATVDSKIGIPACFYSVLHLTLGLFCVCCLHGRDDELHSLNCDFYATKVQSPVCCSANRKFICINFERSPRSSTQALTTTKHARANELFWLSRISQKYFSLYLTAAPGYYV